jgi:hypothetical protein
MNRKSLCRFALVCGTLLALATTGWAKTYHMTSMQIVPAAAADVHVGKDRNGNLQVEISAEHLAKPEKLTPSASTYVVWFQEENSVPQNQGELKIGSDLKGQLKATTAHKRFKVFITGETDSQAKMPSDQVVLRTTVRQ